MTKKNTLRYSTLLLFFWLAAGTLLASGFDGEVRVWPVHGGDRYCSYEQQDYFIMAARSSYITVLVVDPSGYADIVYPLSAADMIRLRAGRIYRLSELMGGRHLYFDGLNGTAYISVIASRRPVFINDWLLDEYYTYASGYGIGFSLSVELGFYWNARFLRHGYFAASLPIAFGIPAHRYSHRYSHDYSYRMAGGYHHYRDNSWRARSKRYTPYYRPGSRERKRFDRQYDYKARKRSRSEPHTTQKKRVRTRRQESRPVHYENTARAKTEYRKPAPRRERYRAVESENRKRESVRQKSTVKKESVSRQERTTHRPHKSKTRKSSRRAKHKR